MRNNDRLPRVEVPDLGARAEVGNAAQVEIARARITGGPARACATPLPHGQALQWPGMALCDALAAEYVRGRGSLATADPEDLAREAARFGVAYVRERDEALRVEAKRLSAAAEIRDAVDTTPLAE